jgi:hypothetical protein
MPANRLLLILRRSSQQEADLDTYLESIQDPNSPNYRQWITPEEFGERYGVSDDDLVTVETWLRSNGFAINKIAKGRMAIEISGTVGQVQSAFNTSLHNYLVNGETYWANATDPSIPAALSPVVAGFAQLNSFVPKSQAVRGPAGIFSSATHHIEPSYTLGGSTDGYTIYLGPADAATVYNTPTAYNPNYSGTAYDGTGATIGIAGDSNIDVSQNANYRATFGLPTNATNVVVDGSDPGENGDAIEAYLDTQVSGGIAPNANVTLYTAANTSFDSGLFLAIVRAIDDNQVDILNVSFGGCEAAQGTSGNQFINNLWQQAAAQGISVTVSSGDSGSAGCDDPDTQTLAKSGLAVNGLASTPYNVAVGGTDFDILYSNFPTSFSNYVDLTNALPYHRSALKYIPEEPWNDSTYQGDNGALNQNVPWSATQYPSEANIDATGGGVSACAQLNSSACSAGYPQPSWQTGVATDSSGRNVPDVSLLAGNGFYGATWALCTDQEYYASSGQPAVNCAGDPTTGNNFVVTGVGGTSAAAPAFAGMLALIKQKTGSRLGQADYVLYDLAKSNYATIFHDITIGNNSVPCTPGSSGCAQIIHGYYYLTGYNTAVGFDEATGLGSVDANQLLSNWSSAGLSATNSTLTLNGGTAALNLTHGTAVIFDVGVTSNGETPSGTIALVDSVNPATLPNNGSIGSFTLTGGSASGSTSNLPGGSYSVSAHYGGSQTFAESDSNAIPVTVGAESSSVNLKVAGSFDPATGKAASTPYYGYIYLLDAQPYGNSASAANPNGSASGTITFRTGTTSLGTSVLSSDGVAELQTTTISGGANSLTAAFPGDASFLASTSAPVAFNVIPAVTSVAFGTSGYSNVTAGTSIPFSATLKADSAGVAPTGTVTFQNGSTTVGTASMVGTSGSITVPASGSASFSTSTLPSGTYSVTAAYSGDANYAASTSTPASLVVNPARVNMVLIPPSSPTPINQPISVIVNLSQSNPNGLQPPTGTVTLTYNNVTSAPVTVVNSTATVTIPANSLPVGGAEVTANYSGDSYYAPASSNQIAVSTIGSGTLKPIITVTAPTGIVTPPVSVTVSVGGGNASPTATGSVSLTVSVTGGSYGYSAPLINGVASFVNLNTFAGGADALTATYFGDSNYTSGTGAGSVTVIATTSISFPNYTPTAVVNQPLNVTATVNTVPNVAVPTGTVTFSGGTYTSSPVSLAAGSATVTIPANSLAIGVVVIAASYSGDANYRPETGNDAITVTAAANPSLSLAGTSVTVAPGAATANTSTITVTPAGGFTGSVTLTAALTSSPAGASELPTLSFGSTSPVSITGASAATATLTVSTTASSSAALQRPKAFGSGWLKSGAALACLLLFGIPASRKRSRAMLGVAVFVVLCGGAVSCGGGAGGGGGGSVGGNPGTTPGSYSATVTATSGTLSTTTTVNITVN